VRSCFALLSSPLAFFLWRGMGVGVLIAKSEAAPYKKKGESALNSLVFIRLSRDLLSLPSDAVHRARTHT
jgi:hypothetical protein